MIGYADEIASEEYNMGLSIRRAQAVAEVLVKSGISKERFNRYWKGEDASVDKSSAYALRLERRVTFRVK